MTLNARIKWKLLKTRLYLERTHVRMFFLPGIVFLLSTLALVLYYNLFQHTDFWAHWVEANGNAFHFCEMNRMDQLIRQPANTWSNLGFFLVGLFTITLGIHDLKYHERKQSDNFLVRYPVFSIMFGLSAIYLFVGSFFFHASLSSVFQKLDQGGMYAVVIMVLVFNLYKIFPLIRVKGSYRSSHLLMVALVVVLNYVLFLTIYKVNINLLFPALVLFVFLTSCYYLLFVSREHYFTNYMWAAVVILVLSTVVWLLDRTSVACSPESIWQGHALWHIFNAVSLFFIYMYYRSGTVPVQQVIIAREERRAQRLARRNRIV
jgi:hypothetical protein